MVLIHINIFVGNSCYWSLTIDLMRTFLRNIERNLTPLHKWHSRRVLMNRNDSIVYLLNCLSILGVIRQTYCLVFIVPLLIISIMELFYMYSLILISWHMWAIYCATFLSCVRRNQPISPNFALYILNQVVLLIIQT